MTGAKTEAEWLRDLRRTAATHPDKRVRDRANERLEEYAEARAEAQKGR